MNRLLLPNQTTTPTTRQYIIWGWVVTVALLWISLPFPFLPKPGEVLDAFSDLWSNYSLADQLVTSLSLNIQAIVLSTILSLGLAYLSTIPVFRPLVVAWGKFRFLSMYGLSFIFTVITSSGHQLKLAMLVFGVSVFFTTGMADVIAAIPQEHYDLARTLRLGEWEILWEVVIRGKLDEAMVVLRQNASMSWLLISFCESMERSEGGVGALLATQDKYFHLSSVMAIQMCVLSLGLAQDYGLAWARHMVCPWSKEEI